MSATTTDPTTITPSAELYVAAVADALQGVAEAERQELLDDLADHLAELAAEDDEALDVRLGPPEAYAAELLASAGIVSGPVEPPAPVPVWRRTMDAARQRLDGERVEAIRTFLPELRPGWWVLRAWCLMALLAFGTESTPDVFPVPEVFGNPFLSLVALVAAGVASIRIGRARRWIDRVATVLGVIGLLVATTQGGDRVEYRSEQTYPGAYGYMMAPDGRTITNIWPYDGAGQPLDVWLFDQDGVPLDVPSYSDGGQVPIAGLFPQAQTTYEYDAATGVEREVPVTAPVVVVPSLPTGTATDEATTTTTIAPGS